ncbi:MAG TPA: twin-arginine translocation signal domain-containing protein, partial [Candidatus Hydrogenedentes bacterium]|nr:twin-arginine translocation signal domain-containing protein [Candidatus Hydrogenedentota bacterium]
MTQEYRPCKCKATGPQATEMARRAFLKRVLAAGAAGALITYLGEADIEALYAAGKAGDAAAVEKALEEWTRQLWEFGATHVYREAALEHIAFPLGGIGAGQIYLTGRGRLTS